MASLVGFVIDFLCVFLSPYEIFKLWILLFLLPDTSKTKHVDGTYSIHIVFIKWDASLLMGVSVQVDGASLVAQMVKNLPEIQETWVGSLIQEDPLEKGMVTDSILVWRIPRTEECGGL